MPFQPVKAESLSAQVFETIREAIFRRELKPGETLRELGLAKSLNVSQATVREALAHLEQYGLVVRTPNRSTNVTAFSQEEVRQRQKIRLALESLAFHEASAVITEQQAQELSALAEAVAEALTGSDVDRVIQSERQFHSKVWEIAGNPTLQRMLDQLTTPLFVQRALNQEHSPETTNYAGLVRQLREGNRESLESSLRKHILEPERHRAVEHIESEEKPELAVGEHSR